MATQAEIAVLRGTATQVKNESQVGGNTAGRVGGLFEGIVDALPSDEAIDGKISEAVADIQPIVIEGNVDNAPDQEDLTSVNQGGTDVLKFKDKTYAPALFSGLGRVYLRKNVVTPENLGYAVNLLTAEMVAQENTIYRIQYDYNLNGETITLPTGCVLEFNGGSLQNGTINLSGGVIVGDADIRTNISNIGNADVKLDWFVKGADITTALTRAMACANTSECGIVDGGNKEHTLLSSVAVNKDNQCRIENLKLKFTASANNQSMFLFDEPTRYAGNVLSFRNCTFEQTNPNDYQNVHCIHLRRFDSTNKGKVENVNVKNFSGYMFICESYLQEAEFNLFKGQYVGGFISFNKEFGTANAFGDYGQGSANIINVVNSGIDNGLSVNNTITDIVDLSKNISATLTNCVWQGGSYQKANFNAINITPSGDYMPVVRCTNCWVEFVNVGTGYYGMNIGDKVSVYTDRIMGKTHIVGKGVYLEAHNSATNDYDAILTIEDGTWPRISFVGTLLADDFYKKYEESAQLKKANLTIDARWANISTGRAYALNFNPCRVDDMLFRLLDVTHANKDASLIFDNGLPIVRQQMKADKTFFYAAIANLNQALEQGKTYIYRLVYRVYPLTTPTSETLSSYTFGVQTTPNPQGVLATNSNTVYVTEGQSTDPNDAEWHEIIVAPVAPTNALQQITRYAQKVGIDIAVCQLWEGQMPTIKDIEVDATDATKLVVNRKAEVIKSATPPTNPEVGFSYYNTAIGLQLWWNGTGWVNALGEATSSNPEVVEKETAASFNADANTTYNINANASALVVTLPTISNDKTGFVKVFVTTSATNGVTFAASGVSVAYKTPYEVAADKTYLFEAWWNGVLWIVSANEIEMPLLPAGFTRKEYIQSTGICRINTGIEGASVWTIDAQSTGVAGANGQKLLSGNDGGAMMYGSGYNHYWGCGASAAEHTSFNITTRKTGVITFQTNSVSGVVDGETFTKSGNYLNRAFMLFSASNDSNPFYGYLWSVLCEKDGAVVFNGIPCTNAQGIAGLYDIVSKTFFASIGTDQFVAGPDYVEPTE